MGDHYIKKEEGNDVVYEKDVFGIEHRIGEVHNGHAGSIWTGNYVEVDDPKTFESDRRGEAGGQKGTFSQHFLDSHPTFYPDSETSSSECDSISDLEVSSSESYSSGGDYDGGRSPSNRGYSSSKSSYDNYNTIGLILWLIGLGLFAYGVIPIIKEYNQSKQRIEYQIPYQSDGGTGSVKRELPITKERKPIPTRSNKEKPVLKKDKKPLEVIVSRDNVIRASKGIDDDVKNASKMYESILPSSEFARSAPKGYAPIVREERNLDAKGNVTSSKKSLNYMSKKELEELIGEIGITYPKTGNWYPIEKSKYPKFYEVQDLNKDGKLSAYEIGQTQDIFSEITKKYPEGDIDSIVKEFIRVTKNKR